MYLIALLEWLVGHVPCQLSGKGANPRVSALEIIHVTSLTTRDGSPDYYVCILAAYSVLRTRNKNRRIRAARPVS